MKRILLLLAGLLLAPQAWADGEGAAKKAGRGVEKGVDAAGRGVKKGAEATGRGLTKAGNWIQKKAGGKGGDK